MLFRIMLYWLIRACNKSSFIAKAAIMDGASARCRLSAADPSYKGVLSV
jgi:hypothetical protein